jgi:hypothetical protein
MATFGQSIPVKILEMTTQETHSRQSFVRKLIRALVSVGMVFHAAPTADGWSLLDTTLDDATDRFGQSTGRVFIFTYPTSETFDRVVSYNGTDYTVPYKPCLCLCVSAWVDTSARSSLNSDMNVYLEPGAIPAGDVGPFVYARQFALLDVMNDNAFRNVANQAGMGGNYTHNLVVRNTFTTVLAAGRTGRRAGIDNWAPYGTGTGSKTALLTTRYWYLYLGPGGLYIQVGSSNEVGSDLRLDVLNTAFIFAGQRIANRAAVSDPNVRHVCPVLAWDMSADTTLQESNGIAGAVRLRSLYVRRSNKLAPSSDPRTYDSAANGEDVASYVYAIRRLDRRYNDNSHWMRPFDESPKLVGGVGTSVLDRLMLADNYGLNGLTSAARPGDVQWFDAAYGTTQNTLSATWDAFWYIPGVRVTDAIIPAGEFTNPSTSDVWIARRAYATPATLCFLANSPTRLSAFPTNWTTTSGTQTFTYNFTGYTARNSAPTSAQPLPSGCAATTGTPNSGSGLASPVYDIENFLSGTTGTWAVVGGQNYWQSVVSTVTSQPALQMYFDIPSGADTTYDLKLSFSASLRGGVENNATYTLYFQVFDVAANGWYTMFTMQSAGANAGNASYTYTNRGSFAMQPHYQEGGRLLCRWVHNHGSAGAAATAQIGDISITASKRI